MSKVGLVWFRRDLRLRDNAALARALAECDQVIPVFIFDIDILNALTSTPWDARVVFIYKCIAELKGALQNQYKGDLVVRYGRPLEVIPALVKQHKVTSVFANKDYEPTAVERDAAMQKAIDTVPLHLSKDHVIYEVGELVNNKAVDGRFQVFTPYFNIWKSQLYGANGLSQIREHDSITKLARLLKKVPIPSREPLIALKDMGFIEEPVITTTSKTPPPTLPTGCYLMGDKITPEVPGERGANIALAAFKERIANYDEDRQIPSIRGTSRLSVHLRFGTISIREVVRTITGKCWPQGRGADVFLSELAWREFFQQEYATYVQPTGCAHMWDTPHTKFTLDTCAIIGVDPKYIPAGAGGSTTAKKQDTSVADEVTPLPTTAVKPKRKKNLMTRVPKVPSSVPPTSNPNPSSTGDDDESVEMYRFRAWCTGTTGYPIVDAAMRELLTTGYMHGRMRLLTASFLIKILGLDWRWGERYFAHHLLDYDYAANMGGWQQVASIGAGIQPPEWVFDPTTQSRKYDKDCVYIQTYLPTLRGVVPLSRLYDVNPTPSYLKPIVNFSVAKARWLDGLKRDTPPTQPKHNNK